MAKAAKARQPLRQEEYQGFEPTPETRKKLRPDLLVMMHSRGIIDDNQFSAAVELREGYHLLTSDVACRTSRADTAGRPPKRMAPRLMATLDRKPVRKYLAWVDEMVRKRQVTAAVHDVIVDGLNLGQIERKRNKPRGWAREKFCGALDIFLDMMD